ncbi:uncharacterized protein [Danio rerio]|uniref:Uncharacterized protein n=2 Tax=Danio rerio TaxID=7955 RepID=A0AC58JBM7_DANRE|nr:uncharacterized protein LOC103911819 [Danio rerio]|eukprot:XP_021335443.1 uncharacterized protein LOC103911819 [Danio rerio]
MMESELDELRRQVQSLQSENEQLQHQANSAARPSVSASSVVDTNAHASGVSDASRPIAERIILIPRERRCSTFSGRGDEDVFEWIEEMKSNLRARNLPAREEALFILDHLGGSARSEIKFRPRVEREDPEKVFSVLRELYGCAYSYISLQEQFFSRKQEEGESLQDFSHALFALMEKVVQCAPGGVPNSAILLRDQFVEHVVDNSLCRELKRYVRLHPQSTILDVRKEAIRWVDEGFRPDTRERSHSVPSLATQYRVQGHGPPSSSRGNSTEIAELKEMLKAQQEQLNRLTQGLQQLQSQHAGNPSRRVNPIICRRCNQPGHIARNCIVDFRRSTEQPRVVSQQSNAVGASRPSENFNPLNC